jgi:hypothetical protein
MNAELGARKAAKNDASLWRELLAMKLSSAVYEQVSAGVIVAIGGSTAVGDCDACSNINLLVVWPAFSESLGSVVSTSQAAMLEYCRSASLPISTAPEVAFSEDCACELFTICGCDVSAVHWLQEDVESRLAGMHGEAAALSDDAVRLLSTLAQASPLSSLHHRASILQKWQQSAHEYPKTLSETLVLKHLAGASQALDAMCQCSFQSLYSPGCLPVLSLADLPVGVFVHAVLGVLFASCHLHYPAAGVDNGALSKLENALQKGLRPLRSNHDVRGIMKS